MALTKFSVLFDDMLLSIRRRCEYLVQVNLLVTNDDWLVFQVFLQFKTRLGTLQVIPHSLIPQPKGKVNYTR